MCTSFVVYSNQTTVGMNFDISPRPIKLVLKDNRQLLVLQKENGQFLPAFGLNSKGTFMNLLEVDPIEAGRYRRGKNCVHIMRLFEGVLEEQLDLADLKEYMNHNSIVNVPNYSVHSLIAGADQQAFIVEPGRGNIEISSLDREFMVLTNFSVLDHKGRNDADVQGLGSERYKKAYEIIAKNREEFDSELGLLVLKETAQREGDYPTQLSLLFVPEEKKVLFTLNADFDRVFEFSFLDGHIRGKTGFTNAQNLELTKRGLLLSELEESKHQ